MQLRINIGRSRQDVAERAGLNVRVVERVETGYHANPQWETIRLILTGIGVTLDASYGAPGNEGQEKLFDVA